MKILEKLLDIFKGSRDGDGLDSDQLTNKRLLEETNYKILKIHILRDMKLIMNYMKLLS